MPNALPEIDLAPFMAAPQSGAALELVARLRAACHGPGFCYLMRAHRFDGTPGPLARYQPNLPAWW